jgi:arylsulfatase A
LATLDRLKLADDTLVVFTSDNGGYSGVADNRPLRKGKGFLYEGGIRIPLIVRWPGHVKPGTVSDQPVISMDYFPTFLDVAGVETNAPQAALDGVSLILAQSLKKKLHAWRKQTNAVMPTKPK